MGLSLFPYQLLILIIKHQNKGLSLSFNSLDFDSPVILNRGTVLKDRPPLKQGLSIIKDFGIGLQRTDPLLILHHQTPKSGTAGDSPSRKIQQSAFASLGFLLRGTVLHHQTPKIRDCPFWDCPCSLSILFLIIKTQEKKGTVPYPLSFINH